MQARGRCWVFGDNIPTDQIVRSDRALVSLGEMAAHVLENLNPDFPGGVRPGDILVAGRHFGQSSGRAIAPKALQATGIGAIVVEYAARLFYRNCFEIGLPLLECPGITDGVEEGDVLAVDMTAGTVVDETNGRRFSARPVDPFLMEMLEAGGVIPMAARLAGEGEA
ncbi:MAG: 3-isopropylmalate dehydratase small subunit [Actinomycetota bacterium]|nr:3-isopropylmalate dehydratase small subunit [Actinomycetota bacterium]